MIEVRKVAAMVVRYEFTEITNLERALHDTLLKFNGDLAGCVVAVAAGADITFKPSQVRSPVQKDLDDEQAAVEVDLPEFLRLLNGMVQIVDGHVTIRRSGTDVTVLLDLRVVDSSFALVETDNPTILHALESRLTGVRRQPPTGDGG